jgi:hypothetical protein
VDATILFLGMNMFSRSAVGDGLLSFSDCLCGGSRLLKISFGAGSDPARAQGLNRLGAIDEVIVETGSRCDRAAYFGFMTSSPEERMEDAQAALEKSNRAENCYAVAEGTHTAGDCQTRQARLFLPAALDWRQGSSLSGQIRARFSAAPALQAKALHSSGDTAAPTFLYAILQALRNPAPRITSAYVYNARRYRLQLDRTRDTEMGAYLASKMLVADRQRVSRYKGAILRDDGSTVTLFQMWAEDGALWPLRVEYKAKSFLKLVLEATASSGLA